MQTPILGYNESVFDILRYWPYLMYKMNLQILRRFEGQNEEFVHLKRKNYYDLEIAVVLFGAICICSHKFLQNHLNELYQQSTMIYPLFLLSTSKFPGKK